MPAFGADPNYRKKLAAMMMQQGMDTSPVGHWTQGAARMAQALAGGMINNQEQELDSESNRRAFESMPGMAALLGGGASPSPAGPAAPMASAPGDRGAAIASIESGGKYDALGPVINSGRLKGDRAYGKHQIMGSNIPSWSRTHFGQELTPEQFLANPQAQEAIFKGQFGQYEKKYGPEGASRAWFAGEGGMNNPNARDQLGTTVSSYADKFVKALGLNTHPEGGPAGSATLQGGAGQDTLAPAPQQMAQAAPGGLDRQKAMGVLLDPRVRPEIKQMIMQQLTPQKPIEVNGRLVDPKTFKVLADFSKQERPTSDIQEYEYAKKEGFQGTLTEFLQRKRSGAGEYGMQPIYGVDAEGKPVIMQLGKGGEAISSKLPPGVTVAKDPIKIDTGTHHILLDPVTRQPIGQPIPKNIAAAAKEKEVGEAEGQAAVNLPTAIATAENTIKTIQQLREHPGKKNWGSFGWGAMLPDAPGGTTRGFGALVEQVKGQNFMTAFQSLKGAGAITEQEGAKAERAQARLDRAQSEKDFDTALKDLEDVVIAGMARARTKAGIKSDAAPAQAQAAPDPLGIR